MARKRERIALSKSEFERLAQFRYELRRFLRFSEDIARKSGITMTQYLLLLQIQGFPGRDWATVGELAERLCAKHHGVVSLVSRCEALGLVARRAHAGDGRVVEVRLTAQGMRTVERLAWEHRAELISLRGRFVVPAYTLTRTSARGRCSGFDPLQPEGLAAVINQSPDAMIYADHDGTILLCNDAAGRLFGHVPDDIIGSRLDVIIPERFRGAHWRSYRQAVESGVSRYAGRVMTTKALHKSGSNVHVDLSFGLIRDATGVIVGVLATGRATAPRNRLST
jgi:PAS domain S-box-containing protein